MPPIVFQRIPNDYRKYITSVFPHVVSLCSEILLWSLNRWCMNVTNTSGVHHKKTNCESTAVIAKVQNVLKAARDHLFPTQLTLTVAGTAKKTKLRKGNGGWGDTRDHRLCWNITVYPDLVLPWDQTLERTTSKYPFDFFFFLRKPFSISLPASFFVPLSKKSHPAQPVSFPPRPDSSSFVSRGRCSFNKFLRVDELLYRSHGLLSDRAASLAAYLSLYSC